MITDQLKDIALYRTTQPQYTESSLSQCGYTRGVTRPRASRVARRRLTSFRPSTIDHATRSSPFSILYILLTMPPLIPSTFTHKKASILESLSVPDDEYSDKSPKGSVDEKIKELIDEINVYEGFVTTSSCAGRISVFQEGNGQGGHARNDEDAVGSSGVPGGKGGGKFLFVSHKPVSITEDIASQQLPGIFCLDDEPAAYGARGSESWAPGHRVVRFAFEPMVRRRQPVWTWRHC